MENLPIVVVDEDFYEVVVEEANGSNSMELEELLDLWDEWVKENVE